MSLALSDEIEVYEEDGVFEASAYIPDAPEPYVSNPFFTAKTEAEAVDGLRNMIAEIRQAMTIR